MLQINITINICAFANIKSEFYLCILLNEDLEIDSYSVKEIHRRVLF